MHSLKKKLPILISMPRCGSTWVQSYIHTLYSKTGITLPLKTDDEFFSRIFFATKKIDIQQKIQVIENLKSLDLELCHMMHVHMFLDNNILWSWFKEYYKDHKVIILKRRNIWKTYISWLFHFTIRETLRRNHAYKDKEEIHPWHNKNLMSGDILKATILENAVQFNHNNTVWEYFLDTIRFLHDEIIPTFNTKPIFWLEDLTDEMLADMFGVEIQQQVAPFKRVNYESYYDPIDLELIKDKFNERFENEFRFYGYECNTKIST